MASRLVHLSICFASIILELTTSNQGLHNNYVKLKLHRVHIKYGFIMFTWASHDECQINVYKELIVFAQPSHYIINGLNISQTEFINNPKSII